MDSIKRKGISAMAALGAGFLACFVVWGFFSTRFAAQHEMLRAKQAHYAELLDLLARQNEYMVEWEKKKDYFQADQKPEEVLNLWVKELLDFASAEKITFHKLEPSGIRPGKGGQGTSIRLYLAFEGNIQKLVHLLYHLLEKDPLSEIEHFSIREIPESKSYAYELTLGKSLV